MPIIKPNTPVLAVNEVYQGSQEEREKQAAIVDAREKEMRCREIALNHDLMYIELQDRALAAWESMKEYLHDNYSGLLNRCSFADFMSYCQDVTRPQVEAAVSNQVRMQDTEDSDAEPEHHYTAIF